MSHCTAYLATGLPLDDSSCTLLTLPSILPRLLALLPLRLLGGLVRGGLHLLPLPLTACCHELEFARCLVLQEVEVHVEGSNIDSDQEGRDLAASKAASLESGQPGASSCKVCEVCGVNPHQVVRRLPTEGKGGGVASTAVGCLFTSGQSSSW